MDAHKARKNSCKPNSLLNKLVEEKVREVLATVAPVAPVAPVASLTIVKPFLKWVGGKTQIIEDVMNLFPKTMKNYHEPFVGGGSVLLALLSYVNAGFITISGKIYASDLNANLIYLYKHIQSSPDDIIREIKLLMNQCPKYFTPLSKVAQSDMDTLSNEMSRLSNIVQRSQNGDSIDIATISPETYYYSIRDRYNALKDDDRNSICASAMFLYLNKTCFRGVFREGPRGFNVPFGHYNDPGIIDETHIQSLSRLIRNVEFCVQSFSKSLDLTNDGDFVYLDPPYAPETTTSFVGYTGDGFGLDHHSLLFRTCTEMKGKNVKMLMSNANVKLVRDAFPSPTFQIRAIQARRAIHSKKPDAKTTEVLITN